MTDNLAIRTTTKQLLASQLDYVLVDGSGSMIDKWAEMMSALDTYIGDLKVQNLNSHLIVSVFDDSNVCDTQRNLALRDAKPFYELPLQAGWGGTPLYDAINAMGRDLRDLNPERASIVIVTDGQESSHYGGSRYTDLTQARAILDWCRAHGWQVTFIGCDFNNSAQARALGANNATAIGVAKANLKSATKALADKRMRYARSGSDMEFSDDEKTQFGGYLAAPGAR